MSAIISHFEIAQPEIAFAVVNVVVAVNQDCLFISSSPQFSTRYSIIHIWGFSYLHLPLGGSGLNCVSALTCLQNRGQMCRLALLCYLTIERSKAVDPRVFGLLGYTVQLFCWKIPQRFRWFSLIHLDILNPIGSSTLPWRGKLRKWESESFVTASKKTILC